MPKPTICWALVHTRDWLAANANRIRVAEDPLSGAPAHRGKRRDMAEPGPRRLRVVDVDDRAELRVLADRGWRRVPW